MKDTPLQSSISNSNGHLIPQQLDAIILDGLQVADSRLGFLRCNFIIPIRLADKDENWEFGAIATLIDDVGAIAVHSFTGRPMVSVDFSVSFYSTAKIQEEVEIEAKVVGDKGKLTSVVVEIRRKDNGQLIALGKQWLASKM